MFLIIKKSFQSPITNHQSPITNHQSPITNHQSPITNHQSPMTVLQKKPNAQTSSIDANGEYE